MAHCFTYFLFIVFTAVDPLSRTNMAITRQQRWTRRVKTGLIGLISLLAIRLIYLSQAGRSQLIKQHAQLQLASECTRGHGPLLAILMAVVGHADSSQPEQLHLSIANKKTYAIKHGYPLYLLTETLGTDQHPVWDKVGCL